ncbi:sugar transferase [Bacillus luteolus]|uniref:Sugar transferase n=1 Tax=Litchfieldia luteola TaxID=682179 RepID=A0ABR9QFH1_9BACI|nr:sugar transferase [Cytobacillus luteolus]MBE4907235.1 sugar transferase [Cytobacillus luteolus]MBP1943289.1 lipopolysaccharide/colanic/teichoic acid biosynthesis glycosyltransferase [Cytobacillus luteolus]
MKTKMNVSVTKVEASEVEITSKATNNLFYLFVKRLIDLIGAVIGMLMILPFIITFSVIYKIGENKGPMFFRQQRIGKEGKVFYIYKFRSMVVDAERKLQSNKVLYKKYIRNNFKLEQHEDPRITKFGRFIRATSIDELPQFINVLKGEMSLVGPRPVVAEELKEYTNRLSEFLSVKPGITGYWQANGRSNVGYPERVDIELYYVIHKSLSLDFKILIKTVWQVINRRGAY